VKKLGGLSALGLLNALVLSGCFTAVTNPGGVVHAEQERLVFAGLSEELIYEYLLGDIAARRGDSSTAAEAMARAAELSSNLQITLRAFSMSMASGDYEQALELSELLESIDTDRQEHVLALRLQALIALDREEAVFTALIALIDALPDQSELPQYIAQTLGRTADPSRWLAVTERVAAHFNGNAWAQLSVGWLAYRAGQTDRAQAVLDRALILKPGWEEVALLKFSHLREGNDNEAVAAFADEFLERYPDRVRLRLAYGRLLAEWNDNVSALEQFEKLLAHDPQNLDALYAAGILSQGLVLWNEAKSHFEALLEHYPQEDRARLYLGQILSEQGEHDEALDLLREIAAADFYFDVQMRIGFVLSDAGHHTEALEHLADVTPKSQDEQVRIYLAREQVLRDSGQAESALEVLTAALIDIPDHPDLLYARGLVTAIMDRVEEHEQDMRRLIEIDPDNAHAYNALGYTLADKTDRLAEALELIEKALALLPGDPFILDSLGWVHYRRGDLDLALEYLQLAMDQRPDAEIAAHLGEVLWQLGNKEQAIAAWQDGSQTDPDNPVLKDTMRKYGQ
jgi:tetratricopeptide (TPR) repeat protein